MKSEQTPSRRNFLDWLLAMFTGVAGLAMGIPSVLYLWPAARGGGAENVEVAGASSMAVGQSHMMQVGGKAVIVVRGRNAFTAFSASCTHLGCLVKWDGQRGEFFCPCHAAVFGADGGVVSGPAPSALPPYKIKEAGGKVYVSA